MAKRASSPEYRTKDTVVRMQDIRFPKWERIQVNFPLVPDRSACGKIEYTSEIENRWSRGRTPIPGLDFEHLTINPPKDLSTSQYKFTSDAPNASNVPEGFYGTSSGIFPIDFIPFSPGSPTVDWLTTDNPVTITGGEIADPESSISGAEFVIGKNIITSKMDGILDYIPANSGGLEVGRLNWEILPGFNNPTEPEVRFPLGARRKNFFK